jgi:hypothetical protein
MATSKRSLTIPVLVAAVAALGWANYAASSYEVDATPIAPADAPAGSGNPVAAGESVANRAVRTVAEFPDTATRPLFFADRRVPEKPKPKPVVVAEVKPVVQAAPPPPPPEPLQLVGLMGSGNGQRALVRSAADPQGTWLSVGDAYRGWQLRTVASDHAVVEAGGQLSELRLYAPGSRTAKQ